MNKFFSSKSIAERRIIAIVRIMIGLLLIYHGWEVFEEKKMDEYTKWDVFKRHSFSALMVYFGKAAELVAGIFFVLGLFTRIAAVLTIFTLGYICFFVGNGKFWYEDQHPFLFVLFGVLFFFTGPGSWSLDALIFDRPGKLIRQP